ncbi:hypothetical protein jhhlp_005941 [Lomentospora prolificans]|uniref:Uncharacterized protein n=1 Tax=Lomentospora prolificans TaxID=41688 RepID=A0A2N3N4I5_9PEZI|nr:hypothetical protein jhhlp_005941 [Lomentospora prolificans]
MVSALSPTTSPSPTYRLANLGNLTLGYTISPAWTCLSAKSHMESPPISNGSPHSSSSRTIQIPPGVYSVRQLVARTTPFLDAILAGLGQDSPTTPPLRSVLIDGLAASLSTNGRESTLPLSRSPHDDARGEIINQADRITKTILKYVHESTSTSSTAAADDLHLRSACEGHLWTPAVVSLLLGPRSDAKFMELYNEWLHRMILLRDSLLPFENFEDVPLVIPEDSTMGIRDVEEPRKLFLVHCLTGAIQHTAIVDLAKVFAARGLPKGGYGFQYSQGLVLPAFLSGSRSLHLLRYHPARLNPGEPEVLFDYEHGEYFNAPRTELSVGEAVSPARWNFASLLTVDTRVTESELAIDDGKDDRRRIVKLRLTLDSGACISVDLGQIARGRRYAYEIQSEKKARLSSSPQDTPSLATDSEATPSPTSEVPYAFIHSTADILSRPGLVISPRVKAGQANTMHIIPTADPVLRLALLGKLYPENVILLKRKDDVYSLGNVGKGFAERFIILETNLRELSV